MRTLRALLVASTILALSANILSAQGGKVTCKDGSKSAGGRGACSGHGGVMTAAMKATAKAEVRAAAKVARADARATKAANVAKTEKSTAKAEVKAEAKTEKNATVQAKVETKAANRGAAAAAVRGDDHDARGATAECKDHTYSHARTHQGACSRHGGVARYITGDE